MHVELACPRCRKTIIISLAPMSAGNSLECTTCGEVIRYSAAADHVAAQQAVDELKKLGVSAPASLEEPERPWWKFWGA